MMAVMAAVIGIAIMRIQTSASDYVYSTGKRASANALKLQSGVDE
jgi:hypothetical protein